MINISVIKSEMERLYNTDTTLLRPVQIKKINSRISFLKTAFFYLESNPDNDFLLNEKNRIEKRLKKIDEDFRFFNAPADCKDNAKKYYENLYGVPLLKKQLKTLFFLLQPVYA